MKKALVHNQNRSLFHPALAALGLLLGCSGTLGDPDDMMPGDGSVDPTAGKGPAPGSGGAGNPPGAGGSGASIPVAGSAPGAGAAGSPPGSAGAPPGEACVGTDVAAAKRIVRLSFNQLTNTIGSLLDPALGTKLATDNMVVDAANRTFPPLQSPREGNSVTDTTWKTIDSMAQAAAKFVFDNFAAETNCGAMPTDACGQQYLTTLAQKAYRRPLTAAEQTRLTTLYTGLKGLGATVNEAVQHGVYAILQAPQFTYRTEFGSDWTVDGAMTHYEIASALSYFLTDDMPDAPLLEAAAQGKLGTPADVAPHVERILQTDAAKKNLHGAMMSYFAYPSLESIVIQNDAFTDGVRNSMYREAELFLQNTLWQGKLTDLLLSKKAYVNSSLAPLYGITAPPGTTFTQNDFVAVDLPAGRTGMLTQAGFLTTRSRPSGTSVVGRGLLIKNTLLCTETPQPPDSIGEAIADAEEMLHDATERQKADYRMSTSPCSGCHLSFDAYGLSLDSYDVIGRFRATDPQGRPIDTSVTLPQQIGGGTAATAAEMAQKLSDSGAFAKCMARNLVNYAFADVSAGAVGIADCAAKRVADAFATTDQSFSSLVKSVAVSTTFMNRSKGAAQ